MNADYQDFKYREFTKRAIEIFYKRKVFGRHPASQDPPCGRG